MIRKSLSGPVEVIRLGDVLVETTRRVGPDWRTYPLIGASRGGLAPAKESIGRSPDKYKLADRGTIFYNPMRVLLGSIAHVDDERDVGITSPDYVLFHTNSGKIDDLWLYAWLRSWRGENLIWALARGAVRERMLFRRLAPANIAVPPIESQVRAAEILRASSVLTDRIQSEQSDLDALAPALLASTFARDQAADQV